MKTLFLSRAKFNRVYTRMVRDLGFPEYTREVSYSILKNGIPITFGDYTVSVTDDRWWAFRSVRPCEKAIQLSHWVDDVISSRYATWVQVESEVRHHWSILKEGDLSIPFWEWIDRHFQSPTFRTSGLRVSKALRARAVELAKELDKD